MGTLEVRRTGDEDAIFILEMKLIAINPETKKAYGAICNFNFNVTVQLNAFVEEFLRGEMNLAETRLAVTSILKKLNESFKAPLGWRIRRMKPVYDLFSAAIMDWDVFESKEFSFAPEHGQTEVNLDFIREWTSKDENSEEVVSEISQQEN